eukprot:1156883-Pelagomonas_calceolata.AAC.2
MPASIWYAYVVSVVTRCLISSTPFGLNLSQSKSFSTGAFPGGSTGEVVFTQAGSCMSQALA